MPTVAFPPFNPGAYTEIVPDDLFDGDPLPLSSLGTAPNNLTSSVSNAHASQEDLEKLWDHLFLNYWPELYNDTNIRIASGGTVPTQRASTEVIIQNDMFGILIDDFENEFLNDYVGILPGNFYDSSTFSDTSKIDIWDGFIRTQEIGRKQYNVLLWMWELLIELLSTMQTSAINKATAQRWMNEAQKKGVTKMAKQEFVKQSAADDYDGIKANQDTSHALDIIRGERAGVQRISSEKSSDASNAQQRMQENNTFIALLIDQLGTALRAIIKR